MQNQWQKLTEPGKNELPSLDRKLKESWIFLALGRPSNVSNYLKYPDECTKSWTEILHLAKLGVQKNM
jgi:hypothetical protein